MQFGYVWRIRNEVIKKESTSYAVCPSVRRKQQLDSQRTDYHEISYWRLILKCADIRNVVKVAKQDGTRYMKTADISGVAGPDKYEERATDQPKCTRHMQ
jgi:hypothetical protein